MMPLWLDLLRTPMAAPETAALRRWRLAWLVLCLALAACITALSPLRRMAGQAAPAAAGVLLVAALLVGLFYFRRKNAADRAWNGTDAREPDE